MGRLSRELYNAGFTPTDRESPIDEDGELWSNGHEVVCDETGVVIDGNHHGDSPEGVEKVFRYRNSERVMLPGGYVSSYEWGEDDGEFRY